ncbi:hypothetical protein [Noviherbaspirillum galbum]|uniref:Uncharacterized protein n=1 Tax=Noviherbaspirillum galbum TaxID=2709383 RepID=A0A6B3SGV9_9BURK|nr:hypothetical protein [Noviherbaspirillum galbum]NEX60117.1 hypothetical protein [Noviherbaspirillum galbum]
MDFTPIKESALAYLHTSEDDEEWPDVSSRYHVLGGAPETVLLLVSLLEKQASSPDTPTREELEALGQLVRHMADYIKRNQGIKADPERDDLLARSRQLLGLIGI